MKRYGNLFEQIISWGNIVLAASLAARRKRLTPERAVFEFNLEKELVNLRKELESGEYHPGHYRTFAIHDPKERLISAAPFRDRVAHHCLCNIIDPLFDRSFLPQNYANRKRKGLHAALKRGSRIVNSSQFLLKADIKKYFPSIDHSILKEKIRRKIKCRRTLKLIDIIIDNSNEQEHAVFYFPGDELLTPLQRRRGLPIGNLTSQLFANIYLGELDVYVVHELKKARYVRYVDDFLIGGMDKEELHFIKQSIAEFMVKLRLKMHEKKTVIFPARRGLTFLGFRLYPGAIRAGRRCSKRFIMRLRQLQRQYAGGLVGLKKIKQVIASYNGHLAHGATEKLRENILENHPFVKRIYN